MEHVDIVISGKTGIGKSRIALEIEIALRAIGVSVSWYDSADYRAARAEAEAEQSDAYQSSLPNVVIREVNLPR